MSSSNIVPATIKIYDKFYDYVGKFLATRSVNPVQVTDIDGLPLYILFQHYMPIGSRDIAYSAMKNFDNCHTCAKRFGQTHAISDMNQSIWNCFNEIDSHYVYCEEYKKLARFAEDSCKKTITDLIILNQPTLFGHNLTNDGWYHITCQVSPEHQTKTNSHRIQLIKNAISRYVTSGLFNQFFTRLVLLNIDILNQMKTWMNGASYGYRFIPSIDWCNSVLNDFATYKKEWDHFSCKEKMIFSLHHIIRAGLCKNSASESFAPLFQTANCDIVGLLECAVSEDVMIKLCENRFDNYILHRIQPAHTIEKIIENPANHMGHFENTILSLSRAKKLIPEMIYHGHEIVKDTSLNYQILNIKNVRDFVRFTRLNPTIEVKISVNSGTVAYLARTTLDKNKIDLRHIWAFLYQSKPNFGFTDEWISVSHTVPMYEYIDENKCILFVTPSINSSSDFKNCCFSTFLTSQYKSFGETFEKFNQTTKVIVPNKTIMAGIGSSVVDEYEKLLQPINLQIGGICVRLLNM